MHQHQKRRVKLNAACSNTAAAVAPPDQPLSASHTAAAAFEPAGLPTANAAAASLHVLLTSSMSATSASWIS